MAALQILQPRFSHISRPLLFHTFRGHYYFECYYFHCCCIELFCCCRKASMIVYQAMAAMECRRVFARSAITALLLASALVFRSESGPKSSTTAISYHDTTLHGSMNSVNSTGSVNVAVQALQLSRHLAGRDARGKRFLSSRFSYYANADSNFQLTRIVSSGDVSPNPGPTGEGNNRAKCSGCNRTIARNHRAVECNHCYNMWHIKCGNVSPSQYNYFYKDRTSKWTCARCLAPATDISANIKNDLRKGIELDSLIPLKNCLHTKDVSIAHMNICGLVRHIREIKILLEYSPVDFLAVTESHLNAEIDDREISINGYKIIRKDRPNGSPWGGCALYHKENLEVHIIHKFMSDDIEAIWAELILNSQRLLIGCLYRPPDDSSFFDKFDEILGKVQMTRKNLVIVGDFNADVSNANFTATSNPMGKKLLATLYSHRCKNVISNPTRVTQSTKSIIDLAIVNNPASKVSNSGVLDLSIADHKTIFVTYKMKTKSPGFSIKRVRNYRGLDEKSLQKDLHDVPWWVTSLFDDIDDVTHAWELLFKDVLDTHIPTRTAKIRKESLPWVTGEIRKEMNKRYKLLRKCDGTRNTSAFWEEYKRTRNKVTKMLREAESTFWLNQFKKAKNAKDFWNTVTEVMNLHQKHKQIGPMQHSSSSELITSKTGKAELINDFFVNIGKNLADKHHRREHKAQTTDLSDFYSRVTPTISDLSTCKLRLASDLNKLKPRKAAGPDGIQAKDLVVAGNSAIDGLNTIFSKSLKNSRFPSKWKLARVAAIFKKATNSIQQITDRSPCSACPENCWRASSVVCSTSTFRHTISTATINGDFGKVDQPKPC